MAQEIEFGTGGTGKIRNFWVGLGLAIVTLSIYYYAWYYFLNDEQKDIGIAKGDQNLASSNPTNSVIAVLVGGFVIVPPFISIYNFGQRIRRAERLAGVPREKEINPITAFLLLFPGGLLIIPAFIHYWYVTKHQNAALRAMAGLDPFDEFADQRQGSLGVGPTTPSQMPPETPPAPGQPGSAATTPPPDQPPGG